MSPSTKSWPSAVPEPMQGRRQLGPDDTFRFGCHEGLRCFTDCCGDVNIFLTPVDVLRLARRRGQTTSAFLKQHTLCPITKELHLPVVLLRMGDDERRRCPFVAEGGCTVYDVRPWACRMYPLGMGLPPARAGVEPEPIYFLNEDAYCAGREEPRSWSVAEWRDNQGVADQERLGAGFHELVSHPWFIGGRSLDPRRMEMFYTGCYDLDAFRRFVFETTFLERFELDADLVATLRTDDEALLRFAFRWLRYALFAEPTMAVRPGEQHRENH